MKSEKEKNKINQDDGLNRTFFSNPTIGGFIVFGIVIIYILYQLIFS